MDADGRGRRRAGENDGDANDAASRKTTHAVVRAVKSSGREGVVFATPVGASDTDGPRADAAAIGVGLAFVEYLTTAKWLAKDFVWLVLDARAGSTPGGSTHAAVHAADAGSARPRRRERGAARRDEGAGVGASTFARAGAAAGVRVRDARRRRRRRRRRATEGTARCPPGPAEHRRAARAARSARVGLDLDPLDPLEDARGRTRRAAAGTDRSSDRKNTRAATARARRGAVLFRGARGVACLGTRRASDVRRAVGTTSRVRVRVAVRARASRRARTPASKLALDAATLGWARWRARGCARYRPRRGVLPPSGLPADRVFAGTLARGSNNLIEQLPAACSIVMTSDDFPLHRRVVAPQAAVSAAAAIVAIALATRGGDGDDGDHGDGDADEKERDGARKSTTGPRRSALAARARGGAGVGTRLFVYDRRSRHRGDRHDHGVGARRARVPRVGGVGTLRRRWRSRGGLEPERASLGDVEVRGSGDGGDGDGGGDVFQLPARVADDGGAGAGVPVHLAKSKDRLAKAHDEG